jgi:hypothetical protein
VPDLPLFFIMGMKTDQRTKRRTTMSQVDRLLEAYRRIKHTPLYQESIAFARQKKLDFLRKMIGEQEQQPVPKRLSEIVSTNSVGLSSTVHGTGGLDLSDLPLLPTRKRRKRLRELVGSEMNDLGVPKNPVMTPSPRMPRRRKRTPVVFNPTLNH